MAGQSALIFGATGQTGGYLLKELLGSSHFTRVGEYGRKTTLNVPVNGKEKLEQKTIDFEKLDQAAPGLKDGKWDVVFITLGTTRAAAGSAEAFEKIDREYVVNAARAAKSDDPNHPQRIVYISSMGANPKSSLLYSRSKGLTEEGLASLGYSDTIIFRPGMLAGANRANHRIIESVAGFITGALSHISSGIEIKIPILAKSLRLAGELGSSGLPAVVAAKKGGTESAPFTLIDNKGAVALAKSTDAK